MKLNLATIAIAAVLIVPPLLFVSCSANHEKVVQVLEGEGCTNIQDHGPSILFSGCDDKDTFNNQFECDRNNHHVQGVVCSGVFKGFTVRYK